MQLPGSEIDNDLGMPVLTGRGAGIAWNVNE
jgi:hypothetical protein